MHNRVSHPVAPINKPLLLCVNLSWALGHPNSLLNIIFRCVCDGVFQKRLVLELVVAIKQIALSAQGQNKMVEFTPPD